MKNTVESLNDSSMNDAIMLLCKNISSFGFMNFLNIANMT